MRYYLFGDREDRIRPLERRNIWVSLGSCPHNLYNSLGVYQWDLNYGPFNALKELKVKRTL